MAANTLGITCPLASSRNTPTPAAVTATVRQTEAVIARACKQNKDKIIKYLRKIKNTNKKFIRLF